MRSLANVRQLVLWDIDHTLIENNGVSKEIYGAAFALLAGREPDRAAETDGRTDLEIMWRMFEAHGRTMPNWLEVETALEVAGDKLRGRLRRRGCALPGAKDCLQALAGHGAVVQSVLTGNVMANAKVKLATFGLHVFIDFEVGAYGADGMKRADLVAIAQQRTASSYGDSFDAPNTVLIGDTLRDVHAGREGGARVIAVATGTDTSQRLADAGADLVLDDLQDAGRLVSAILGV